MNKDEQSPGTVRYLILHSESDCYFEVYSEEERNRILESDGCCADVTDDPVHEAEFARHKQEK